MKYIITILSLLFIVFASNSQTLMNPFRLISGGPLPPDTVAKFDLSKNVSTQPTWVVCNADPTNTLFTSSDSRSGTAIGISTVSTSAWGTFSGSSNETAGYPGGTNTLFSEAVRRSIWFSYNRAWSSSADDNIILSNLNGAKTYKIIIFGSFDYAVVPEATFDVSPMSYRINGTEYVYTAGSNQTTNLTVTGITPTSNTIRLFVGKNAATGVVGAGVISAIILLQEN